MNNNENTSEPLQSTGTSRALVLGGGGPVGRAWQAGLIAGFARLDLPLGAADLIIGTSAGAVVGAELALELDLGGSLPEFHNAPAGTAAAPDPAAMQQFMTARVRAARSPMPEVEWRQIGHLALESATPSEADAISRPTLAALVGRGWPSNLWVTSVSATTGQFTVWDKDSNAELQHAVAASSALPSVWPPITIGNDRYVDGGVRSTLNADLARGHSRVLVVSCFSLAEGAASNPASAVLNAAQRDEIEALKASGSAVEVLVPDDAFRTLTGDGTRMLDGALGPQAYAAGLQQAPADVDRVRKLWN